MPRVWNADRGDRGWTGERVLTSVESALKCFSIALALIAMAHEANANFLPDNHLDRKDSFTNGNLTEKQFNEITDTIVEIWRPFAEGQGATLVAEKDWEDSTVNAFAHQNWNTNVWSIHMFGGLARRPEITPDGYALVVCHELGHHFGGYPFYSALLRWGASEGQSDYFATQVCARRIWEHSKKTNAMLAKKSHARLDHACDGVWQSNDDRNLCYRITTAGISLASLLAAANGEKNPTLETRDTTKVSQSLDGYPSAQCRLDTYLHGALCTQMANPHVIPGKTDRIGANSRETEKEASRYSCMEEANFRVGYRPRCWFKSIDAYGVL